MTDLHPGIVHFPVALIVSGWLFEAASLALGRRPAAEGLRTAARWCLRLGVLAGVLAVLSGHQREEPLLAAREDLTAPVQRHEDAATLAFWISVAFAIGQLWLEGKDGREAGTGLRIALAVVWGVAAALILRAAYIGGVLVHIHMMGG